MVVLDNRHGLTSPDGPQKCHLQETLKSTTYSRLEKYSSIRVNVLLSSVLILHSSIVHAAVTLVAMDRVRYKSLFVLYSTDPLDSADCDPCTLESVSHGARSFPRQFHRKWF